MKSFLFQSNLIILIHAVCLLLIFNTSCTKLHLRPDDYNISDSHKDELLEMYVTEGELQRIAGRVDDATDLYTKTRRNEVIEDVMYLIDKGFEEFAHAIYEKRAQFNIIGDVTNLGLATAGTLVGSAGAKTTYAALGAAFNGAQFSIDSHLFQEQGTLAIVRMMEAERANVKTEILLLMKQDETQYSIGAAFLDLKRYYKAGTLVHALNKLTQNAGNEITLQSKRQNIVKQFIESQQAFRALIEFDKQQAKNEQAELQTSQEIIDMVSAVISKTPERVAAVIKYVSDVDAVGTKIIIPDKLKQIVDHTPSFTNDFHEKLKMMPLVSELTEYLIQNDTEAVALYDGLNRLLTPIEETGEQKNINTIINHYWGDKNELTTEEFNSLLNNADLEEGQISQNFAKRDEFKNLLMSEPEIREKLFQKTQEETSQ